MFTLEPADSIPTGFFPDTDQIQISVQVYEDDANLVEEFHFGLFYRDSDDQAISAEEEQLQKSFNCPYVYLEAASGRTEEDSWRDGITYYPYLMMYLKGYAHQPDRLYLTAPENGVCDTVIVLRQVENQREAQEYYFAVNSTAYYDSGRIEGNFTTTVILEDDIPVGDSFIHLDDKNLYQKLWELETGPAPADEGPQDGPASDERTPRNRRRRRKRSKVRNMSSHRRSSIFLDFKAPATEG